MLLFAEREFCLFTQEWARYLCQPRSGLFLILVIACSLLGRMPLAAMRSGALAA
jgi:hypothetical protein